jgi:NAD(P)-dependent dehydrogenase (short-subunit alcohol dehydrogenase family)
MFTVDLADELAGRGVTANALHPGTFMPTKILTHAGVDLLTRWTRVSTPPSGSRPTQGWTV